MSFPLLALSALVIPVLTVAAAARTRRYFLFGMLGSVGLLAVHGRIFLNFISDDAYIYFRYAHNLAQGHGPVWNTDGKPVEGYTGILWLLPLAAADKLGLDLPQAARYIGFALGIGSLALLYPLSRALPGGEEHPLAPVAAGLLLAAASPFALWTFGGLEVPLLVFLLLLAVWLHLREDAGPPRALPWSGLAFALATATRPEAALLGAVTGVFKLAGLVRAEQRKARLLQVAVWAASGALVYGAYFAWRYDYYGYLLPNTFYAKVAFGRDAYNRGLHYLVERGTQNGLLLLAAGLLAYVAQARPLRGPLYLAALAAAWLAGVVLSGGDVLVAARFLAPIMPVLCLGAVLAGAVLLGSLRANPSVAPAPALALAFTAALFTLLFSSLDGGIAAERMGVSDRALIGRWMADTLPAGTTIAVTPAGAIPYYARLPAIDMLGLTDAHIAHRPVSDFGSGYSGHEKYDVDYVLERRPAVIFIGNALTLTPVRTPSDYLANPWPMFAAEYNLVHDPRTFQMYRPVAIQPDGKRWLNLLVDRQAEAVLDALAGPAVRSQ